MNNTPFIHNNVYGSLPAFLQKCSEQFDEAREKDVILTSCLTILSGCFTGCRGRYSTKNVGPGLYSFIVAPAASGKGIVEFASILAKSIHTKLMEEYRKSKSDFELKMRVWNKQTKSSSSNLPEKPKCPVLLIPGNSSAGAIYDLLSDSNGVGIIYEPEADTMVVAMKQDWGNFSDVLRKAFQNEPLSLARRKDKEYIHIANPQLSVLLAGTPNQVSRLIQSAEDGLHSRFIYYCYERELEFLDPTPCEECPDVNEVFEALSKEVEHIKDILDQGKHTFRLTHEQFQALTQNFALKVRELETRDTAGTVYRLGLIAFRIAMVLTILRNQHMLATSTELTCSDKDLDITLSLTDVYFEHALVAYSLLPHKSESVITDKSQLLFSRLPKDSALCRKDIDEIGKTMGLSKRTVGTYLSTLVEEGLLTKPKFGEYQVSQPRLAS